MLYSVDRFEGDVAVLVDEDGNSLDVPLTDLPEGVKSGDMLCRQTEGFRFDADATDARRARVLALQDRLRNRK